MNIPTSKSGRPFFEEWLTRCQQQLTGTRLLLLGLLSFLGWASLSHMDQTVRSNGQVIAASRNQIIQAADGGVLTKLLVTEGQQVHAGQALAMLETTRTEASYQEVKSKLSALHAALARANAESSGQALAFHKNDAVNTAFQSGQAQVYLQRKQGHLDELKLLRAGLELSEDELRMSQSLLKTGDVSQLEMMRAQRQVHETQGRIAGVQNKYLQDAKQDVIRLQEEISTNQFKLNERQSLLDHSVLTTPVDGVVKFMRINTVGGVLRAGDELMHISPSTGGYIVEAKINPSDIGELRIGQPVSLKLDAFDYSVYGMLNGTLSYISSDTFTDSTASGATQVFYRIQVQIDPNTPSESAQTLGNASLYSNQAAHRLRLSDLKPGMTATLDIRTRSRSVLQYLAKPVQKAFSGALHER
ncbi:HlyD family efflux transporter periplasmic adaptor subunit [Limnohabitans sp. 103DPR2]|uniref:HlyD family efflux transporter periplasmic adaptor subunit n=1 Tax=Limnohabitans sp. 103DPR2 TaxID=1678129 RepID=UPI0006DC25F2|nr:HlyD family efflux transporter periplasmic adaptor subunit [Limnohabitans sp. 103DPR2]ALK92584.1 Type I secretion system membrane fusion protein PrsE [Limnohabitans sp. 103DPR2]